MRRIERRQRRGALREWTILQALRNAFWGLDLPALAGGDRLAKESKERLFFALQQERSEGSRPHSLSRRLREHEYARQLAEEVEIRGDAIVREGARSSGHALTAEVVAINQPRLNYKPCVISVRTTQPVTRVRRGTLLQTIDGSVTGRIEREYEDSMGFRLFDIRLEKGVRVSVRPSLGAILEWVDAVTQDLRPRWAMVYSAMSDRGVPPDQIETLTNLEGRYVSGDLLDFVEARRQGGAS